MKINIPEKFKKVRDVSITKQELLDFESRIKDVYENGKIKMIGYLLLGEITIKHCYMVLILKNYTKVY